MATNADWHLSQCDTIFCLLCRLFDVNKGNTLLTSARRLYRCWRSLTSVFVPKDVSKYIVGRSMRSAVVMSCYFNYCSEAGMHKNRCLLAASMCVYCFSDRHQLFGFLETGRRKVTGIIRLLYLDTVQ